MSYVAPTLQAFFTDRLVQERQASALTPILAQLDRP